MSTLLAAGDLAPWFRAPLLGGNPNYAFESVGGRPIVLLLLGSASFPGAREALALLATHRSRFDDVHAAFFGVSTDPIDAQAGRIATSVPGVRWFLDHDQAISRRYGAVANGRYTPHWLLLDRALRVVERAPLGRGAAILDRLETLAVEPEPPAAPVLVVPRVLPPPLCRQLIALYEADGGNDSGFMSEEGGATFPRYDYRHKRRSDCVIKDAALVDQLKARIKNALAPMLQRAFQFRATRIERFMVGCYDGETGGHFRPHRDNTTSGTAHRRFACTINLNAEEYEGGDLRFPEFGDRRYRAPTGGAVLFSCSLLHEALPVTRGRRYAFLPFLYDEAAAALRERNLAFVRPELKGYRADPTESAPAG